MIIALCALAFASVLSFGVSSVFSRCFRVRTDDIAGSGPRVARTGEQADGTPGAGCDAWT